MKLRQLFEAEKKTAVAAFGRLNPPTTGHKAMVDEIKKLPGDHFLFLSHSQGAKNPDAKPGTKTGENKDPLSFEEKLPLVKQAFPGIKVGSADVTGPLQMASKLYKMGYTDLIVVAGSDRMSGYKALFPRYNGESGPHGEYKFNSIEYVELTRDEDAEGVQGMSASKLRQAVRDDDFDSFKAGLLAGNAEQLFKTFRERLSKDSIGIKQEEPIEEGLVQDLSTKVLLSYLKRLTTREMGPYEKSTIEKIKQELQKRKTPVTEQSDSDQQFSTIIKEKERVFKKSMSGDTKTFKGPANRLSTNNTSKPSDITKKAKKVDMPDEPYELDFDNLDKEKLKKIMPGIIDTLTIDADKQVLRAYFGLAPFDKEYTLTQIGNSLGVSKDRASQRLQRALRQLRHPSRSGELRQFLDDINESDVVLDKTVVRMYIRDRIKDYLDKEDDINKLAQILKGLVGKTVKARGSRYLINSEDVVEACKYGEYYCSTDNKTKCRQGPKKSRG